MSPTQESPRLLELTKRALLLGGSSAIGFEIMRKLATGGFQVLFTYNKNSEAAEMAEREFGASVRGIKVDLSSSESVKALLRELRVFGAPEAFINSAGVTDDRLSMSGEQWASLQRITMINYLAPAWISSAVGSLMAERRGGFIVHITSAAARQPRVGNATYGASKVALERFTASLALELARFKVRTLCVAPAFVDTPMFAAFAGDNRERIIRTIPMRQILRPQDVADVAMRFVDGGIASTGTTIALGNGETSSF